MSSLRAVGLFAFLASLWGLSFPAITVGLESLPPVLFAAFRYDVAAVLLLAYAAGSDLLGSGSDRDWLPTSGENRAAVLGGGVFLVAGNGLLFVGQQTVPSGVAAIIQGLVPIATTLWALLLLPDERVTPAGAAGIALGFLGVGLVVRPDPGNLLAAAVVGKLLIVAQVASVSLGGVLVQRARPTLRQTALVGWSMAVGAALLHVVSAAVGESAADASFGPVALGAVLYLGVFSTALAFFIYFTLLERHGAMETSLVAYLVPVVATVAGVALLGERVTGYALAGFLVIFAGFALLKRRSLADLVEGRVG